MSTLFKSAFSVTVGILAALLVGGAFGTFIFFLILIAEGHR